MSEVMKLLVVIYGLKSWANLVHQQSCIRKLVIGMVFNYSPQFAFNPPLATCRYNFFFTYLLWFVALDYVVQKVFIRSYKTDTFFYKGPRVHNAHLGNIVHYSNEPVAVFGIDDRLTSLIQTMESLCILSIKFSRLQAISNFLIKLCQLVFSLIFVCVHQKNHST